MTYLKYPTGRCGTCLRILSRCFGINAWFDRNQNANRVKLWMFTLNFISFVIWYITAKTLITCRDHAPPSENIPPSWDWSACLAETARALRAVFGAFGQFSGAQIHDAMPTVAYTQRCFSKNKISVFLATPTSTTRNNGEPRTSPQCSTVLLSTPWGCGNDVLLMSLRVHKILKSSASQKKKTENPICSSKEF